MSGAFAAYHGRSRRGFRHRLGSLFGRFLATFESRERAARRRDQRRALAKIAAAQLKSMTMREVEQAHNVTDVQYSANHYGYLAHDRYDRPDELASGARSPEQVEQRLDERLRREGLLVDDTPATSEAHPGA